MDRPSLSELAARVTFTREDLAALEIDPGFLEPFLLAPEGTKRLKIESHGNTSVERFPLISFGNEVVFACPTAVSPAVRRFTLDWVAEHGDLDEFAYVLGKQQEDLVFDRLLRFMSASADQLADGWPESVAGISPPARSAISLCAIDRDKVGHVILQHDNLRSVRVRGLLSTRVAEQAGTTQLQEHVRSVAALFGPEVKGGIVLLVGGGFGRGRALRAPELPAGWHVAAMSLPDLESFAWADGTSLLKIWKLFEELDRLGREKMDLPLTNGLLNFYAHWEQQGFSLVPPQIPYPPRHRVHIRIATDHVLPFRIREYRRNDIHASSFNNRGDSVIVRRLHRDPFFKELSMQPVYGAVEFAEHSLLAGVVEGQQLLVWVRATSRLGSAEADKFYFKIWEGLLDWINRILPSLEPIAPPGGMPPFHVRLSLLQADRWSQFPLEAGVGEPAPPTLEVSVERAEIEVGLPYGFLALLRRPQNDAERALLETACTGLLMLIEHFTGAESKRNARDLVKAVMPTANERALHLFEVRNPAVHLATASGIQPRFLSPEDQEAIAIGLTWPVLEREPEEREVVITGREQCLSVLNGVVSRHWSHIRERLVELEAVSVIRMALENSEVLHGDREHWRHTAQALFALHGGPGEVVSIAGRREGQRALSNQAARVLAEMALSTSPLGAGRSASYADFDSLTASIAALLRCAADSDAIRGRVAEPRLAVKPNGTIESDEAFMAEVATPYVLSSFSTDYRAAASKYGDLFLPGGEKESGGDLGLEDTALIEAFQCEYGLTPLRFLEAAVELVDFAAQEARSVPLTTRAAISARLREKRGFAAEEVDAFFRMIALERREQWDKTPPGYAQRDWQPWHFRRRLSLVSRPLVVTGVSHDAPVLYGAYQMGASASYLLEGIRLGWFPNEFFVSKEMRRYQGSVAERLGHAFTADTAAELSRLGWEVRTEVQMRTLGAPKALGDVDVVAWSAADARLLLIECKRLQPARNVGEIAERLKQFRGESLDRLGRHLRRVEWISAHLEGVRKKLHLPAAVQNPFSLLITNSEVPMQYKRDLVLPPDHVMPLKDVGQRLRPGGGEH